MKSKVQERPVPSTVVTSGPIGFNISSSPLRNSPTWNNCDKNSCPRGIIILWVFLFKINNKLTKNSSIILDFIIQPRFIESPAALFLAVEQLWFWKPSTLFYFKKQIKQVPQTESPRRKPSAMNGRGATTMTDAVRHEGNQ